MTLDDFSNGFDTLLNSYASNGTASVALDEYEKSFFLTKSQEQEIIDLYSGNNSSGDSFENTEEMRRNLSNLVVEANLEPITDGENLAYILDEVIGVHNNSEFFQLPEDTFFITYEEAQVFNSKCGKTMGMDVYPTTQDEYHKIKRNPFRGMNNRRALRLDLADNIVEIISKYPIKSYYLRYLKKPEPIILINLPDGLSIEGVRVKTPCKLNDSLHQRILDRAVVLAMQSKVSIDATSNRRNS
jgi:hypothetical protein